MKTIIIIICVCVANYSYAQHPKRITVPLVRENPKIDSLMESVIRKCNVSDRYFCFEIIGAKDGFLFGVFQLKTSPLGICFPPVDPNGLSYFKLKGYTIFVTEDENSFGFFRKNHSQKTFSSVWGMNPRASDLEGQFSGMFVYKDGKFSDGKTMIN